jgi:hypothetical protein
MLRYEFRLFVARFNIFHCQICNKCNTAES